jgi:hypothetical protein
MYKLFAVIPIVAFAAAVACSDMTAPSSSDTGVALNQGASDLCPNTDEETGWFKIDSNSGSESGDFGSFSYEEESTTLTYQLHDGWVLEFCLKAAQDTTHHVVSGSGTISTGTQHNISHISWRVIEEGTGSGIGAWCSPGFWMNAGDGAWERLPGIYKTSLFAEVVVPTFYDGEYNGNPTLEDVLTYRGRGGANHYGGPAAPYHLNAFNAVGAALTDALDGFAFDPNLMDSDEQVCPLNNAGDWDEDFYAGWD